MRKADDHINNLTIGFLNIDEFSEGQINCIQQNVMTDVGPYQVRMASNIYESADCFNQFYQVCVEATMPGFDDYQVFTISEYWVCWAKNQTK